MEGLTMSMLNVYVFFCLKTGQGSSRLSPGSNAGTIIEQRYVGPRSLNRFSSSTRQGQLCVHHKRDRSSVFFKYVFVFEFELKLR